MDVDVHHGDGVQAAFWDDPRVLTVSIHESPLTLFPGTGFPDETGGPGRQGSAVNVALPPGTDDAGWLRAFHAVVPDVLRAFRPQVLVTQCGADTYRHDPLANLRVSVDGQRATYIALRALADELCDGRWVATGGGGYALFEGVPRAWTHLLATRDRPAAGPRDADHPRRGGSWPSSGWTQGRSGARPWLRLHPGRAGHPGPDDRRRRPGLRAVAARRRRHRRWTVPSPPPSRAHACSPPLGRSCTERVDRARKCPALPSQRRASPRSM